MANLDIARNARWQNVANFVLGAWLFISPWVLGFSDAGKVATNAWDLRQHHRASRPVGHLRLPEVGRVADGSHRRLGVHLPMGVGRGIERAHPVELAGRRGVAGDSGALVVLARARIRSDRNATLTREPKVRAE
jgi:SPW repeat